MTISVITVVVKYIRLVFHVEFHSWLVKIITTFQAKCFFNNSGKIMILHPVLEVLQGGLLFRFVT